MSRILQTAPRPAGIVLPSDATAPAPASAAPTEQKPIVMTQHSKAVYIPVEWPTDSDIYRSGEYMDDLRKLAFDTREMREFNAFSEKHLAWAHASMLRSSELMEEFRRYVNAQTGAIRKRGMDMFMIKYKPKSRSNKGILLTNIADQPDDE